ncbi:MAG: hypothetical protein HYZ34_12420 [Ignavibacteriae bacterium]|nr:hypothetical protein [Ignavibacteriota bacterium]
MKQLFLCRIATIISGCLFGGCSGISLLEMQDAETLQAGRESFSYGLTAGPSLTTLYSDTTNKNIPFRSFHILEGRYQVGLSEKNDLGFSLWSSSIFHNILLLDFEKADFGIKCSFKHMLTERESDHKVSLGFDGLGHYANYGILPNDVKTVQEWTGGFSPFAIYSYTINSHPDDNRPIPLIWFIRNLRSVYLGMKMNILWSQLSYEDQSTGMVRTINATPVIYSPFIGVTAGDYKRQFLEIIYALTKNPYSNKFESSVFVGFGVTVIF